jgi:hypothetical protein
MERFLCMSRHLHVPCISGHVPSLSTGTPTQQKRLCSSMQVEIITDLCIQILTIANECVAQAPNLQNNSNPTNSLRSVSNVRTRSATVNYAFNISNPCVREDNVSHAETADSYTHPESNPPSPQMSPVRLPPMSPVVQASAASETELYPPSNPSPASPQLYPPETPPLASPVPPPPPPPRADEGPVSSRTRSAKARARSM